MKELWEKTVLAYIATNLAQGTPAAVAANAIACADAVIAAGKARYPASWLSELSGAINTRNQG